MAKTETTTYKLKDLLKIKNGKDHKALGNGSIPVYGSGGIMRYADSYLYDKASILLPRKGSLDNIQYCDVPFWTVDTIYYTEVNESLCDAYYLYRYLKLLDLSQLDSGTGVPSMTFDSYYQIEVKLPPLEAQKRIASMLKALDSKIHINEQINRNLEALAKQLYEYWFVQFDFPNKEGKPYKSSGGKMVWNNKLQRFIPLHWNDCDLNRYVDRITNGLNPRKNFVLGNGNNFYVTIRSLVGTDIDWNNCDRCDDDALKKINNRSQLQIGDVIFSAIGTIGRTYFIQEEPTNWNISETSFTVRAKEDINPYFFYSLLCSEEIQKNADKKAMGSTLRCLVMDSFCKITTVDIDVETIDRFSKVVQPIYEHIYKINKMNKQLIKLRDELLPLLMNGQVSVNSDLSHD